MPDRPLLMIPGPVEVSPAVREAYGVPPPGHLAPPFVERFGRALRQMREVWEAPADHQPFVVAGSGTLGMDMAAANVAGPGHRALVVETGYFSLRTAEGLRRFGVDVEIVPCAPGEAPSVDEVARALDEKGPFQSLFFTHVDTSTGVRSDPGPLCALARERGLLSVVDGVCATGAERFAMGALGADVYLTGSQKALGLPAGLALLVASPRALEARRRLERAPPLYLDWLEWEGVMRAYETGPGAYFATPATTLVAALDVGLGEILADELGGARGIEARVARHARAAKAMRAGFAALGLSSLTASEEIAAHTLSALRYPAGVGPELVGAIKDRGVVVAGGLHPDLKATYFRVGHMGWVTTQPELLARTVGAVGEALAGLGQTVDVEGAVGRTLDGLT